MILRNLILIFVGLFSLTTSYGQAGLIGALNSVEGNFYLAPALTRTNTLELDGTKTILNKRLRFVYPSYSINYTRILSRKLELSAGFGFSMQRSYQGKNSPVTFESQGSYNHVLMEDPIVNQKGINLEIRKYVNGSIAPIGKFFGICLSVNRANLKKNQELIYADFLKIGQSSFFNKRTEVKNIVYGDTLSQNSLTGFTLSFSYGRNMIISNNLMWNYTISMPVISVQRSGGISTNGVLPYQGGIGGIEDYDLTPALINTYRRYNGIRLQLGVKYFF
jgi:hypothetical protein